MTYTHIVDILIIAKFLLISTTTSTHRTQTATTLVHTDTHRQTVTINSGAYTPHTVTDNTVTLYSIHSFNDTHYSQDNNNRTYW